MRQRFGHAVEHQPDTHTGGEQHRKPAKIGVIWCRIRAAKTDFAQRGNDQNKAEQDKDVADGNEEPIKVLSDRRE